MDYQTEVKLKRHLVVRLRTCDFSLYDGNVNHSFSWHRYTDCDNPDEEQWICE